MHEASIALSILSKLEEITSSAKNVKRVTRVKISVGMLSMVDIEALKFALEVLSKGTIAEGMRIDIEIAKPRFKCSRCQHTWVMEDIPNSLTELKTILHLNPEVIVNYLQCPKCGSRDVEIIEGSSIILQSVEVETA